jgi:type I restriction enzyme S subunit
MNDKIFEIVNYNAPSCCVFKKTKEKYGGLSNMASGYPLTIQKYTILTSEALYQACRFPHRPELQNSILNERSPMAAKIITKPHRSDSRADWESIRVDVMRWCLKLKLAQNFDTFGNLLDSTMNMPIVEDSHKDHFWGAIKDKTNSNILTGQNVLGKLLVEIREFYNKIKSTEDSITIHPPDINNFLLINNSIIPFTFDPSKQISKSNNNSKNRNINKYHQGKLDL